MKYNLKNSKVSKNINEKIEKVNESLDRKVPNDGSINVLLGEKRSTKDTSNVTEDMLLEKNKGTDQPQTVTEDQMNTKKGVMTPNRDETLSEQPSKGQDMLAEKFIKTRNDDYRDAVEVDKEALSFWDDYVGLQRLGKKKTVAYDDNITLLDDDRRFDNIDDVEDRAGVDFINDFLKDLSEKEVKKIAELDKKLYSVHFAAAESGEYTDSQNKEISLLNKEKVDILSKHV